MRPCNFTGDPPLIVLRCRDLPIESKCGFQGHQGQPSAHEMHIRLVEALGQEVASISISTVTPACCKRVNPWPATRGLGSRMAATTRRIQLRSPLRRRVLSGRSVNKVRASRKEWRLAPDRLPGQGPRFPHAGFPRRCDIHARRCDRCARVRRRLRDSGWSARLPRSLAESFGHEWLLIPQRR